MQEHKGEHIIQMTAQRITPCLWFDTRAEEAAKFYTPVFESSKIGKISRAQAA
jgi:predicted 3-demethylubiquinone-9 3-methyltransferase (glyoxalase superfamily)